MDRVLFGIMLIGITVAMVACAVTGVPRARRGVRALGGMTDDQCVALMEKRDDVLLAAKILGGVGGLGALATPLVDMEDDRKEQNAQWGIAAGAGTVSAVAVGVLWYGERKSQEFELYCEMAERDATSGASPVLDDQYGPGAVDAGQ